MELAELVWKPIELSSHGLASGEASVKDGRLIRKDFEESEPPDFRSFPSKRIPPPPQTIGSPRPANLPRYLRLPPNSS